MITELFNPKVCFAKELRSSWSKNIKTISSDSNKIPISNVGQEICLHFEHTGDDSRWLMGLLPLNKGWTPEDLTTIKSLTFCYYSEGAKSCRVLLTDENDADSVDVNVTKRTPVEDAICEITIPIQAFIPRTNPVKKQNTKSNTNKSFDITKTRFLKFTGASNDSFYVSRVRFNEK